MPQINVIARYRTSEAKIVDTVDAKSFAEAVAMVFANRIEYPTVTHQRKNRWSVTRNIGHSRILTLSVWCRKAEAPVPSAARPFMP